MKRLFLVMIVVLLGHASSLHAREPARRDGPREAVGNDAERDDMERRRMERFAERRERLRGLREEMLRTQPRPGPNGGPHPWSYGSPFRDEDLPRDVHRMAPDRRDPMRPPMPPLLRDNESIRESLREGARENMRRLTPEERQEFRRQLHNAGRDVYRGQ
ncbi:hypothetical protein VVD49_18355 [Uliginosibacterium sp. H3]|uniref:LTXXQ motif family protein n=1 Tax=Uliginosibacterium silvisoli TaxID=3114758 RepID=A0ABU6K8E3_9RHOO|nr:hypothetical protein [Uliginosibacterium sp. H3]